MRLCRLQHKLTPGSLTLTQHVNKVLMTIADSLHYTPHSALKALIADSLVDERVPRIEPVRDYVS